MNKIIYLDAAASALKPDAVVRDQVDFLEKHYSNAGRGICARAAAADAVVARGRAAAARLINARPDQIVFTSGTTDGMNRVTDIVRAARGNGAMSVAVSDLDHHSARMPWAAHSDTTIIPMALDDEFNIDPARVPAADVVVITAMSNVLGRPQDVAALVAVARAKNPNVITVVDAAQYVVHCPIDVAAWGCDFLCFSAHKIGADTGLGVMYIREPDAYSPDKFGGGMVRKINGREWIFEDAPAKFEAGTLPLTQIAGLPAAIDSLPTWGAGAALIQYLYDELSQLDRIKILTMRDAAILSFVVDGMHVLDFGAMIGARDVCLRVGNMCASWIHAALGIPGSIRISVGPWNTMDEMRAVVQIIRGIVK